MIKRCLFLGADSSGAEDRVVKAYSGHPQAIELARKHPAEFDAHRDMAARLFSILEGRTIVPEEITSKQRNGGKTVKHAYNYDMGPSKLQEIYLKREGIYVPVDECQTQLKAVDVVEPWIAKYKAETKELVIRNRWLRNSWGAEIDYKYNRLDDALFRSAYAWGPQGDVGAIGKIWGYAAVGRFIRENKLFSRINLPRHDEVVLSVVEEEAYDIAVFLDASLSQERTYPRYDVKLSIPAEVWLGRTAGKKGRVEFKRLPDREEFVKVFRRLLAADEVTSWDSSKTPSSGLEKPSVPTFTSSTQQLP